MNGDGMEIPYDRLSPEVLKGLIEDYITRQIVNYCEPEFDLAAQVTQVRMLLESGKARIVFDDRSASCEIVRKV